MLDTTFSTALSELSTQIAQPSVISTTVLGTLSTSLQTGPGPSVVTSFYSGLLGPTGPAGPPGPGADIFQYTPPAAQSEWVLNHNFGRLPLVQVLSPGGVEVEAEVVHISTNQVRVYFNQPQQGTAIAR